MRYAVPAVVAAVAIAIGFFVGKFSIDSGITTQNFMKARTYRRAIDMMGREQEILPPHARDSQVGPLIQAVEMDGSYLKIADAMDKNAWPKKYELHLVTGYKPEGEPQDFNVKVVVDRPGKDVILVLASYGKVIWELEQTPGTRVAQVVLGGAYDPWFRSSQPVQVAKVDMPREYDKKKIGKLLQFLEEEFHHGRMDSMYCGHTLPPRIVVGAVQSGDPTLSVDYPPVQDCPLRLKFDIVGASGVEHWTQAGPVGKTSGVIFPAENSARNENGEFYTINKDGLVIVDEKTGEKKNYPLAAGYPEFSWPSGIAYAPDGHQVAIVSFGGEGVLYKFDATSRRWIGYGSLGNTDFDSLLYDPYAKMYLGMGQLSGASGKKLLGLSSDGRISELGDMRKLLSGYDRSPGNTMTIIPLKDCFVVMKVEQPVRHRLREEAPRSVKFGWLWVVKRDFSRAWLTYKG